MSDNITPHPAAQALEGIKALIVATVREELKARGATRAELGPRALRLACGLEIQEVADKSGISDVTIGKIERGIVKAPKADTMNKIARALGVAESEYRRSVASMLETKQ